ncbi:membrane protein insertion efficiency factor YidD [Myxococcota bacterium]|nr:membrane protein insertion efficiency factor YidD [Myxococcota bacterium]
MASSKSQTLNFIQAILIGIIRLYRLSLGFFIGNQCRFYPSCSHYTEDAIRIHGALKGSAMGGYRIARCNPWNAGGHDPVPLKNYAGANNE